MYCGKCGKEIPDGQTICENCVNDTKNGKFIINKQIKIALIIIIIIILLSIIIAIINNSNSALKKDNNNLKENTEINNSIENTENEANNAQNKDIYTDFDISVSEMQQYIDAFDNSIKKEGKYKALVSDSKWYSTTQTISPYYPVSIKTYYYNGSEICLISIYTNSNGNVIGIRFLSVNWEELEFNKENLLNDISQLMFNMPFYLEKLTGDKELQEYLIDKLKFQIDSGGFLFNEYKKGIKFSCGKNDDGLFSLEFVLEKYIANSSNSSNTENENTNNITSSNSNNTTNNSDTHTNTNTNINSKPKKETIEMPYFQMGYELKEYTDDLDKLGIKYKIVKKSNLDYEDNTVINVEHNGENIEKGTTITITVADNVYDLGVRFDTYYLLELADISATDYENKTINVKVDVKGKNVFNGNLPLVKVTWAENAFTIKGKPDIRNDFEITVEGKKITKKIKTYYFLTHEIWVCEDYAIGS